MNLMRDFLLDWYDAHQRDLPWRKAAHDPYAVWVSEIMLQQTRVSVVMHFYYRWMSRFPTVESLAEASLDQVFEYWQGLGYYRRARGLHQAAKIIAENGWPTDREGWQSLPGVGSYTAGAVLSIAYGQPEPAVDGNVERVYARLFGRDDAKPELNKAAKSWVGELIVGDRPGDLTQALMELGATVCTPTKPNCESCPVRTFCGALSRGLVDELPRPAKPTKYKEIEVFVRVPIQNRKVGLDRLPEGSWGAGLFGFPRMTRELMSPELPRLKHTITNHRITVRSYIDESGPAEVWTSPKNMKGIAITALDEKVLKLVRRQNLLTLR